MPVSTIHTHAATLADAICACIGELDLEDCDTCFTRETLCSGECPPSLGWCGGPDSECTGLFVNFVGTEIDMDSECNVGKVANYDVGIVMCPPVLRSATNPEWAAHQHFAECIMFLAEKVWACLGTLMCNCFESLQVGGLDITSVGGIQCQDDRFVITVSVRV